MQHYRKDNSIRYDRISLRYVSLRNEWVEMFYGDPASYEPENTEALDAWCTPGHCELGVRLELNGSIIWDTCNIKELTEIALLQPGDAGGGSKQSRSGDCDTTEHWPFICFGCGIPECAGVFQPVKASCCGEDIILGLPEPLGQAPPEQVTFRKYRLNRRDFLDAVIDVVKFRLAFENMMLRSIGQREASEIGTGDLSWLTEVFGLPDSSDWQLRISQRLRDCYPRLLESRRKMEPASPLKST